MLEGCVIRKATVDDADVLHEMLVEFAVFERLDDTLQITPEILRRELANAGALEGLLAELDGQAVGMALFYPTFASFSGGRGLCLEDLYVKEAYRYRGIGKAMLVELAKYALALGCTRVEWSTLAWNAPAIEFYESIGAQPNDAWTTYRLHGAWLHRVADGSATARSDTAIRAETQS